MNGLRILADENIPGLEHFFEPLGSIRTLPGRAIQASDLRGIDVLLVRSVTRVDEALLKDSPVRFVGTATIGTDHLDTEYLRSAGIHWASAPGCNALAVGDYVLSCLALATTDRNRSFEQLSVGIVGCGNVGGGLQQRLSDIGLTVLANDPPREAAGDSGFSSLDEVLACDAICLHAPLVSQGPWSTHYLLDTNRIEALRSDQILISAGRGAVVDNQALHGRLKAPDGGPWTALDVWENEPGINADLAQRVSVATPHIAGYSLEGKLRGTAMIHDALCRHLGVQSKRSMEPLLPPAQGLKVDGVDHVRPFPALTQALLAAYNPALDSVELKRTLSGDASDREVAFDRLRKTYPVRREFGYLLPEGVKDPAAASLLTAAGFAAVTGKLGS
ncbi:4-phosphoerythronate dehydrogenase [Halospina denitrificans]|uniref:Erythronate-4-phosphate dehydrogenase n=1 Tax=Halospina denitrificans TaxID=332522 RepID=A0A4R7JMW4_9GAMM|nr:4-phosphoerythronate dehydrogenase [Halospina denitrificans]TDT39410.1 4-phosphoerythronate dehydrogenase [Halospina denitrificans]